mmetsp:Transcript_26452/g.43653  ORF Transcript_26452/g.43653 Transcript_26452/m.43653 type:complete len:337 (-) Transcript_26452:8-1018(-)
MIPAIDAASSEGEEILLLLMHHLPPEAAHLWHGCDDMLTMLREGGITCYTTLHQISDRIRSQQLFNVESNKFRKKRWFALHEKKDFSAPKQQLASKKQRPQIEPNYFTNLGITFKFIKTSKAQTTTNTTATNTTASTTATNNNPTTTAANNNNNNINIVSKYTHGKRLYLGRSDSFEVIQLYVAMTINNDKVAMENKIRKILGVTFESSLRDVATTKSAQVKDYHRQNKKSEAVIERRKKSKIASTKKSAKNSKAPKRHKTDKLSPKEDCRSNKAAAKPKATTRKRKCRNCGKFHNGECQEPTYDKEKDAAAKKKKKSVGYSKEELMALVTKHASF